MTAPLGSPAHHEQPAPAGGTGDVWRELIDAERDPRLIERWEARRQVGIERYGVPLGRGDGRDPWRDLLEELDDAVAYAQRLGLRYLVERIRGVLIEVIEVSGEAPRPAQVSPESADLRRRVEVLERRSRARERRA